MKISTRTYFLLLFLLPIAACDRTSVESRTVPDNKAYVRVSESYPRYFELSNGNSYIAIGCNIAAIDTEEHLEHYMKELHDNGANFARVWLNSSFFEIEPVYGQWDPSAIAHIDRLLVLADRYGIKIKMCIESFRKIRSGNNRWDTKASYHTSNGGPFENMQDYVTSERGHEEYLRRLGFLHDRYGDDPSIFGWELWNEMNAVEAVGVEQWNDSMLPKVHSMFPHNMVLQSLGSLDRRSSFPIYEYINRLPSNDVMQVHRYIDLGAELPVCGAPSDVLASEAVGTLLSYGIEKPVLLAEGGAVMPSHAGPHPMYETDTLGTVLHDFLFAPFFSGAAGSGHLWHWDHYIDKVDCWFQIGRFAESVKGLNPVEERFVPVRNDVKGIRVYTLSGNGHIVAWCRDTQSTWQNELVDGIPARTVAGAKVDFAELLGDRMMRKVEIYDPWLDRWSQTDVSPVVPLPEFKRSLVIKITLK